MNGFPPPPFLQNDLLYPARRMWKRVLPNCSQSTVEAAVLGIDRTGDIPGSRAPEIWFAFLRSGGGEAQARLLSGICDHNVRDISGLSALLRAFAAIAASPLQEAARFSCDAENLAMLFRRAASREGQDSRELRRDARELLELAARDYPRSCIRLGFDLFRAGRSEDARAALKRAASDGERWRVPRGETARALALRALASDAERRLKRNDLARSYCLDALRGEGRPPLKESGELPGELRASLLRRQERLERLAENSPRERDFFTCANGNTGQ
jgi:hypothetical protein